MTESECELIMNLGPQTIEKTEFADRLGRSGDCAMLTSTLINEALQSRRTVDAECALRVGFIFGFNEHDYEPLVHLFHEDWHHSHENIVLVLSDMAKPESVGVLVKATTWIPKYLDYDDNRALAVKAIWALGRIASPDATEALKGLLDSDEPLMREAAEKQIAKRSRN